MCVHIWFGEPVADSIKCKHLYLFCWFYIVTKSDSRFCSLEFSVFSVTATTCSTSQMICWKYFFPILSWASDQYNTLYISQPKW